MKKHIKTLVAGICSCGLIAGAAAGCVNQDNVDETTADTTTVTNATMSGDASALKTSLTDALALFGAKLFKNTIASGKDGDKNILISPYSVYMALGMTANGATGESLSQMENILGMKTDYINEVLLTYPELGNGSGDVLKSANSLWINESMGLSVEDVFKKKTQEYYGADAELLPFDSSAKDKINNWVSEKTDKMIDSIVDNIPPSAFMYLINAVAFDAKWEEPYSETDLEETEFTREDGSKEPVTLMHSTEGYYFKDDKAEGFKKYYKNRDYSFLAVKPDDGVSLKEYVNGLSAEYIQKLAGKEDDDKMFDTVNVYAAIPQFTSDYNTELSEILKEMGMKAPFSGGFENISKDEELAISRILHKTHIDVFEDGTKAAAATAVELKTTGMLEENRVELYLNRPFMYMIIDEKNNIPLFIGCVDQISQ